MDIKNLFLLTMLAGIYSTVNMADNQKNKATEIIIQIISESDERTFDLKQVYIYTPNPKNCEVLEAVHNQVTEKAELYNNDTMKKITGDELNKPYNSQKTCFMKNDLIISTDKPILHRSKKLSIPAFNLYGTQEQDK